MHVDRLLCRILAVNNVQYPGRRIKSRGSPGRGWHSLVGRFVGFDGLALAYELIVWPEAVPIISEIDDVADPASCKALIFARASLSTGDAG